MAKSRKVRWPLNLPPWMCRCVVPATCVSRLQFLFQAPCLSRATPPPLEGAVYVVMRELSGGHTSLRFCVHLTRTPTQVVIAEITTKTSLRPHTTRLAKATSTPNNSQAPKLNQLCNRQLSHASRITPHSHICAH